MGGNGKVPEGQIMDGSLVDGMMYLPDAQDEASGPGGKRVERVCVRERTRETTPEGLDLEQTSPKPNQARPVDH